MLLLDKGYFDYDHVTPKEKEPQILWEDTVKSDEEAADIAAMFGIGKKKAPQTEEEIQQYILNQKGGQ